MVPGMARVRVRSLAQVVAAAAGRRRDPGGPAGRADVRLPAADLARRGATRRPRHGRRARDGRRALRAGGRRRRRPPPDAHRPEGLGQDDAGRAHPRPAARPDRRRVAGADRGALPVRRAARRARRGSPDRRSGRRTTRPRGPGVLGGGSGRVRPGEVSKAHLGVLFLDEFPLFPTDVVEALRAAAGGGRDLDLARRGGCDLPGRGRCSCSRATRVDVGSTTPTRATTAAPAAEVKRREYRRKISGPIADRIDITRFVEPLQRGQRARRPCRSTGRSRARRSGLGSRRPGAAARSATPACRGGSTPHVPGPLLREQWPLTDRPHAAPGHEVYAGRLTRRGAARVHRRGLVGRRPAPASTARCRGARRRTAAPRRRPAAAEQRCPCERGAREAA